MHNTQEQVRRGYQRTYVQCNPENEHNAALSYFSPPPTPGPHYFYTLGRLAFASMMFFSLYISRGERALERHPRKSVRLTTKGRVRAAANTQ